MWWRGQSTESRGEWLSDVCVQVDSFKKKIKHWSSVLAGQWNSLLAHKKKMCTVCNWCSFTIKINLEREKWSKTPEAAVRLPAGNWHGWRGSSGGLDRATCMVCCARVLSFPDNPPPSSPVPVLWCIKPLFQLVLHYSWGYGCWLLNQIAVKFEIMSVPYKQSAKLSKQLKNEFRDTRQIISYALSLPKFTVTSKTPC